MNDVDKVVFGIVEGAPTIRLEKEGRVVGDFDFDPCSIVYGLHPEGRTSEFFAGINNNGEAGVKFSKTNVYTYYDGDTVNMGNTYRANPDLMKQVINFIATNKGRELPDVLVSLGVPSIEFTESGTKKADIAKKGVSLVEKQTFGKTDAAMKLPEEVVRDKINRYIGGRKRKTRRSTKRR